MQKHYEILRGLEAMYDEGQGVFRIEIFPPEVALSLLTEAMGGNGRAQALLRTYMQVTENQGLCLLCDNVFSVAFLPHTLVLITAERDKPDQGMINAICGDCVLARTEQMLLNDTYRYWKEHALPDAREINPVGFGTA